MSKRNDDKSRQARLMANASVPVIPQMTSNGEVGALTDLVKFIARRAAERDFATLIEEEQKETH